MPVLAQLDLFHNIDKQRDGYITKADMSKAIELYKTKDPPQLNLNKAQQKELFVRFCKGRIKFNYKECAPPPRSPAMHITMFFTYLDLQSTLELRASAASMQCALAACSHCRHLIEGGGVMRSLY